MCVVYVNLCVPQTDSDLIGWTGNSFEFLCNNSQIKRECKSHYSNYICDMFDLKNIDKEIEIQVI